MQDINSPKLTFFWVALAEISNAYQILGSSKVQHNMDVKAVPALGKSFNHEG
jgi:hypothetical protein